MDKANLEYPGYGYAVDTYFICVSACESMLFVFEMGF